MRLAMRRLVAWGRTSEGERVNLIMFGHTGIYAVYRGGKVVHSGFGYDEGRRQWLRATLKEV